MLKYKRPYAERLRSERARLGLSQAQLAAVAHVSKTTQVGYEADSHVPDLEYVDSVKTLGVDGIFLCCGTPESTFVAKAFDWELHGDILTAIFQWADECGVRVPTEKLADLVHQLYEQSVITRTIEPTNLARVLRLVAA